MKLPRLHRSFRLFPLAVAALILAGCYGVHEHRARHVSERLSAVDSETRERLVAGRLSLGDAPFAAYVALGTPQYTYDPSEVATVWVYWGVLAGEKPAEQGGDSVRLVREGDGPPPAFLTRADPRLPRRGEHRQELRLFFAEESLTAWTLGPIDLESANRQPNLEMGTLPWHHRAPSARD